MATEDLEREQEILEACEARLAAGEPRWSDSTAPVAFDAAAREAYWQQILPAALRSGKPIDYGELHREARRLAAERLGSKAP